MRITQSYIQSNIQLYVYQALTVCKVYTTLLISSSATTVGSLSHTPTGIHNETLHHA